MEKVCRIFGKDQSYAIGSESVAHQMEATTNCKVTYAVRISSIWVVVMSLYVIMIMFKSAIKNQLICFEH